ncbi:MAG: hypothetical protein JW795_15865 [Chitinivibrionales bacterium]|nr:hypothetical protein [Chitinivibrionales bacterium]
MTKSLSSRKIKKKEHSRIPMALFIDLDGTLLDDRAAKRYYMPKLYHRFNTHIRFNEETFPREWKEAIRRY